MYTPEGLTIFTKKTSLIRFPLNSDKPYKVLILPENFHLADAYENLSFNKTDIKIYVNPKFKIGGKIFTASPEAIASIKKTGLTAYTLISQVDKTLKNAIIDLNQFGEGIRAMVGGNLNAPRAYNLFLDGLNEFASDSNFHNTLLYITDTRKVIEDRIFKRLGWIPIFHAFKSGFKIPKLNTIIFGIIKENGTTSYIKVYDENEEINYAKSISVLKSIKSILDKPVDVDIPSDGETIEAEQ